MSEAPLLQVDVAAKHFGQDAVLGPIRFAIAKGESVALVGPSGIGKSTLLRMIAGLDKDFQGSIQSTGRIGMVFQEPTLLPWRSVIDNLTIVSGCSREEARAVLSEFQLSEKEGLYPGQLSLGQQRRLAFARAIAYKADFLVMDEPFASLDEALVDELLEFTGKVLSTHSMTSLLVTHSKKEAETLARRILKLEGKPARLAG